MQLGTMIFAILFGLIGTLMLNLGKGIAKYGINKRKPEVGRKRTIFTLVWASGIVINIISALFTMIGTDLGIPSIIAALGGIGLTSLVLFSYFILDESLEPINNAGIVIIIIATFFVGLFSQDINVVNYNVVALLSFVLIVPLIWTPLVIISVKRGFGYFGIIMGSLAGAMSGLAVVLIKIGLNTLKFVDFILGIFIIILAIFLASIATVFTQYGLVKAKANLVVPSFNSFYIIVPLLCDFVVFAVILNPVQIIGIISIIAGIILMTGIKKNEKKTMNENLDVKNGT